MRPAEFTGEHVTAWPYVRGHYDRDMTYKLWLLLEAENAWPAIFWDNPHDETPVSKFGDLVDWVGFMESPAEPRSWLIIIANDTGEICGLLWFDKQRRESAFGNIWMASKYRGGRYSRDTVKLGCEYAFYARGWQTLFTMSPWPVARNLVRRCGWKPVADIPGVYQVGGKPTTTFMSKITREDYESWEKAEALKSQTAPAT